MTKAINIGSRRELFVDDLLIERMTDARLQLQKPERREVAACFDAPWEDFAAFPIRILPWHGGWRLYYRAGILDLAREAETSATALAESRDGIKFTRPDIGLCEYKGSKQNNILRIGGTLNMAPPFLDANPDCLPEQRFKGVTGGEGKLWALSSSDGLRWKPMQPAPLELPGWFDTLNTAFWDTVSGCYRCYTRSFHEASDGRVIEGYPFMNGKQPVRAIQHATSPDFIHWSPPEQLQYADGEIGTQLYTNAIVPCPGAEHIYLGFPNRFVEERKPDPAHPRPGVNDALFMASRDGVLWTRRLDAWVPPGLDPLNWTDRNNYPVWGIAETSPTEWSMFISEHYEHKGVPTRLRRLAIRPWGFVSVHADYAGGEMLTKPITFAGGQLRLNARTSAAGSIRVEAQDADGRPVPGFALHDMAPWFGDALDAAVAWKNGGDISALAARPVRLRFEMKDADLFALRFVKNPANSV